MRIVGYKYKMLNINIYLPEYKLLNINVQVVEFCNIWLTQTRKTTFAFFAKFGGTE